MDNLSRKRFEKFVRDFRDVDMLEYASSIDLVGLYQLVYKAFINKFRKDINKVKHEVEETLGESAEQDTAHDGLFFQFKFLYDQVYLPDLNSKPKKAKIRKGLEDRIQSWLDNCSQVVGKNDLNRLNGYSLVEAFPYGLELIMHTWYVIEEDRVQRLHGNVKGRAAKLSSNLSRLAEHTRFEFKKLILTSGYSDAYRVQPDKFVSTGEMAFVMEAVYGSLEVYQEYFKQIGAYFDYFIDQLANKRNIADSVNGVPLMLNEETLSDRLGKFIPLQIAGLSGLLTSIALGKAIHDSKALDAIYKEEAISFLRTFLGEYKKLREREIDLYGIALKH